jgi:hypothetical protein
VGVICLCKKFAICSELQTSGDAPRAALYYSPQKNRENRIMGSKSEATKRGMKAKADTGKLSLYPLSVEDALRAAARTGRAAPTKSGQANRKRKKRATSA